MRRSALTINSRQYGQQPKYGSVRVDVGLLDQHVFHQVVAAQDHNQGGAHVQAENLACSVYVWKKKP